MLEVATEVIKRVADKTDRVMMFHSGSGKDSIALLDLAAPHFKEIICVYMYYVKGLRHIQRYINWTVRKYPNVVFVQVPCFALGSMSKGHYLGFQQSDITLPDFNGIRDAIRKKYKVKWCLDGFKMSDGMEERLKLKVNGLITKNNATPLGVYTNKDILDYIERRGLMKPENYGCKGQSCCAAPDQPRYLAYLRENFPEDLESIYKYFPRAKSLLFRYDNYDKDIAEQRAKNNTTLADKS